ncbi:MAG: M50 family metallopeptidase [Acidobacteria bacterium]|nr:M50 family metallopeptidase [Acidobacteriota bacterium]
MQRPRKILSFSGPPKGHSGADWLKKLAHRVLGVIFGLFLFLPFLGLVWLTVRTSFRFGNLLPLACLGFIGLFGLNLVVQNLLGRSDQEGFFYTGLDRLLRRGSPVLTMGAPGVLFLDLLQTLVHGTIKDRTRSLGLMTAWLTWLLVVAVHEVGHLLAARGAGLEPIRWIAGPLDFQLCGHRWRLGLSREWISAVGGWVQVRHDTHNISAVQALRFAAGGPLASALLLAVFLFWNPYPLEQVLKIPLFPKGAVFSVGILYSVFLLAFNLLPVNRGPGRLSTDGYQILAAYRALRRERGGKS